MVVHFDIPRTNVLHADDGNIQIKERWPRKNWTAGPPPLPAKFASSHGLWRSFDSLQCLQARRTQRVSANTLRVPLEYVFDAAPTMTQISVEIHTPQQRQVWSWADFDVWKSDESRLQEFIEAKKDLLQSKTYHFIPIDINQLICGEEEEEEEQEGQEAEDARDEEHDADDDDDDDDDDSDDDHENDDEAPPKKPNTTKSRATSKRTGKTTSTVTGGVNKARGRVGAKAGTKAVATAGTRARTRARIVDKGEDADAGPGKAETGGRPAEQWGLIVLHLEQFGQDSDHGSGEDEGLDRHYNLLHSYAVINPDNSPDARAMEDDLANRLLKLLEYCGIDTTAANAATTAADSSDDSERRGRKDPWIPPR
jgi:hypothetical protein